MPVEIKTSPEFARRVRPARLRQAAERALRAERVKGAITIYVTGNAEIRKLNRRFHATNAPTDVLSFPVRPARSRGAVRAAGGDEYLGDVVISYEQARSQAHTARWRTADELDLLAVHGILHLLGYDDLTRLKRRRMWQRQVEILGKPIKGEGELE